MWSLFSVLLRWGGSLRERASEMDGCGRARQVVTGWRKSDVRPLSSTSKISFLWRLCSWDTGGWVVHHQAISTSPRLPYQAETARTFCANDEWELKSPLTSVGFVFNSVLMLRENDIWLSYAKPLCSLRNFLYLRWEVDKNIKLMCNLISFMLWDKKTKVQDCTWPI